MSPKNATLVISDDVSYDERVADREYYGIAEIADSLGLGRPLVTAWRKRRSHGMPEPDAELASGPIWRAATVEPWIAATRGRLKGAGAPPASADLVLRVCRRVLRLGVLLLTESPADVRPGPLARAVQEARELVPLVEVTALDETGRLLRDVLAPVESDVPPEELGRRVVAVLPKVSRLGQAALDGEGVPRDTASVR